jgi:hypothetical protein
MNEPTIMSILAHTTLTEEGCNRWRGVVNKKTGQCQISYGGKKLSVTRLVWMLAHPRAKRLTINEAIVHKHDCPHADCINPDHLLRVLAKDAWRYRKNVEA